MYKLGLEKAEEPEIKLPTFVVSQKDWIFTGRSDAEAEAPNFGHLMWRADSLEKTLMLGKIEGKRRSQQRMKWLDSITDSKDTNLSKLWKLVEDREASATLFSFCLQSFPATGSFPMNQLFTSGGQYIGVSASASVLPMSIQGWFPLGLTGWVSLQSKGPSRVFCSTTIEKHQCLVLSFLYEPTLTSYMTTGKTIVLTILTFVSKVMSLLLHMLSRFVIAFLPRSKYLLISWL